MKGLKSRTPGYVRAAVDRRRRQQKYTGDLLRSERHDAEKLLLRGLKGIFHECTVSIGFSRCKLQGKALMCRSEHVFCLYLLCVWNVFASRWYFSLRPLYGPPCMMPAYGAQVEDFQAMRVGAGICAISEFESSLKPHLEPILEIRLEFGMFLTTWVVEAC